MVLLAVCRSTSIASAARHAWEARVVRCSSCCPQRYDSITTMVEMARDLRTMRVTRMSLVESSLASCDISRQPRYR